MKRVDPSAKVTGIGCMCMCIKFDIKLNYAGRARARMNESNSSSGPGRRNYLADSLRPRKYLCNIYDRLMREPGGRRRRGGGENRYARPARSYCSFIFPPFSPARHWRPGAPVLFSPFPSLPAVPPLIPGSGLKGKRGKSPSVSAANIPLAITRIIVESDFSSRETRTPSW